MRPRRQICVEIKLSDEHIAPRLHFYPQDREKNIYLDLRYSIVSLHVVRMQDPFKNFYRHENIKPHVR